ncbi:MAG TPA: hypothetical protein VKY39_02250 [Aggregatilineales bacterium]|nr:hypothetical protein [Aggregatilineales bacterium]
MWIYLASLPERLVRAAAALLGGVAHRLLELVLPGWARRSRIYQATVDRMLRLIVELLGGVEGVFPQDEIPVGELAARKAAGNVVELIGFAAIGWSPVWVLAAAADLTGGTRLYLHALVDDLKVEGVVPADAHIDSVEELLETLERVTAHGADMVDLPPLNVAGMRQSWQALGQHAAELPNPERLARIYADLQHVASQEGRSLREASALVAASAMRTGVKLGSLYIFDYYRSALDEIFRVGLWRYLRQSMRPYLSMVIYHLNPRSHTYTGRAIRRVRGMRGGLARQ